MPKPTFISSDLDGPCMIDGVGLTVAGQEIRHNMAIPECRVVKDEPWCRDCGGR
jgi:transposase